MNKHSLVRILTEKMEHTDQQLRRVGSIIFDYECNPSDTARGSSNTVRTEVAKEFGGINGAREKQHHLRGERWAYREALDLIAQLPD